ncbi:fibronectin type III domain-containing protein [Pseudomarimonas salicorniae]|uniref:Fibronectin type III domain-containing protein n=1 Tax=Pseudomarimonas salicorniae TaxID=2933270 RepID=A0ABT0GMT3_9GAMM|nr:fibronectin type III domain-containing protein [Lysobacter sp. CAU 1642]MCK7595529.1 fibronectin type III domain-containing protein [Lysobacter sp. CAU 1642]
MIILSGIWRGACAASLALAGSFAVAAQPSPASLPEADWSRIRDQIQAAEYQPKPSRDGFEAGNPAQGYRLAFQDDGSTVVTGAEAQRGFAIGIRPQALGYAGALAQLGDPISQRAEHDVLHTRWSETFREWWENRSTGAQQWFELSEPPAPGAVDAPLEIVLAVDTPLALALEGEGSEQALRLFDAHTELRYAGLKVWDATGRALPANMVLEDRRVALQVDDRGAVYPVTIDPTLSQQAYLKASNTEANDRFGFALALSGDTLVVGAPYEASGATGVDGNESDNGAYASGAAYVFVRSGNTWVQQAYLKASNTGADDQFGRSVAIDGDTMVVGAWLEDSDATAINGDQSSNAAQNSGAAYVFVRSGGVWSQQAYLKASNAQFQDQFGWSVSIDGDTLVVGAHQESSGATGIDGDQSDNTAPSSGAAYVFVRSNGNWSQQAYLKASNSESNDRFGHAVAIHGNTLAIGAVGEASSATGVDGDQGDNGANSSGATYVFLRSAGTWTQQAYLKASNTGNFDAFGTSVGLDGDMLVVGAFNEASNAVGVNGDGANNAAPGSGAAYVFVRSGGSWGEQAYLKASNTGNYDTFGNSVAISGDVIAVGAPYESSDATGVDGDGGNDDLSESGAAYLYTRSAGTWTQTSFLKSSSGDESDYFGHVVVIAGGTVVAGAIDESSNATGINGDDANNSAYASGAAYVFAVPSYRVRGSVAGLAAGNSVVLQNNGGDDLTVAADGPFAFSTALVDGSAYAVTVSTQPSTPNQTCEVGRQPIVKGSPANSGMIMGADVTDLLVTCTTNLYTVGGSVSGLAAGKTLVLQNNGGDDLSLSANGAFTFATALPDGSAYSVSVLTAPSMPNQTCALSRQTPGKGGATLDGVISGSNVGDILVTCTTNTYTVGGSVAGLAPGNTLVLQNNGGDDLSLSANGAFTFATALPDGSAYSVSVLTAPSMPNQTCALSRQTPGKGGGTISGMISGSNVGDILVTCSTNTYTVGGSVSGLAAGNSVVLQNNDGDALTASSDGAFTFATALPDGSPYSVAVRTQPTTPNQICEIGRQSAGKGAPVVSGVIMGANVTDLRVTCTTQRYTIGGSVSGLSGSGLILRNNDGDDLAIAGNGSFTFALPVVDGGTYAVSVWVQPSSPSQTCVAAQTSTSVSGGPVTSVTVNCSDNASAPSAPTNVQVGLTGSTAVVRWDPPASNGGAPITEYTVTLQPGGLSCTVSGNPPPTTCTISGVPPGTYTAAVSARNAAGSGPVANGSSNPPFAAPAVIPVDSPWALALLLAAMGWLGRQALGRRPV